MRILFIQNGYPHRGGEEAAVQAEIELLRHYGHEVQTYQRGASDIGRTHAGPPWIDTIWSRRSYREVSALARRFEPDVAHLHDTFPFISPSVYWALTRLGVPVVQTLHSLRAFFLHDAYRRGEATREMHARRRPGRTRNRVSNTLSAASASVGLHRILGSFRNKVARYIASNDFARAKFIDAGLPAERIVVKPLFADVPPAPEELRHGGLFVGRLAPDKGVAVLADALRLRPHTHIDVIGSGPLHDALAPDPRTRLNGLMDLPYVLQHMRRAAYLVLPGLCYENLPRTLVQAFACGLPVIASRAGATAELIREQHTGLLFTPGSAAALANTIAWAEANPEQMRRMGANARAEYEARFTPQKNYWRLMTIYGDAIEHVKRRELRAAQGNAHG
jgi:glycosyltransferase involved in cell wall biosynthesis